VPFMNVANGCATGGSGADQPPTTPCGSGAANR
jgi:uncharacterized spore protein YtfJ